MVLKGIVCVCVREGGWGAFKRGTLVQDDLLWVQIGTKNKAFLFFLILKGTFCFVEEENNNCVRKVIR